MFKEMRLNAQELSREETIDILNKKTNGTLAINGTGQYPYSVPISYVYDDGKIYFHGAAAGQKYDLMKANPSVSFSVIDFDDVQPDKFTTYYKSVILYGDVKVLESPEDVKKVMTLILGKYCSPHMEGGMEFLASQMGNFCVYELDIKHMTGKQSE